MAYEMKDNSGSLFKNDKREKDTHPHASGSAVIDGVHYWVSAWTNTSQRDGSKYQSLQFKRKEERAQQIIDENSDLHKAEQIANETGGDDYEDLPF